MDPKLSNLDPKLQDAYNRVMNGGTPQQPQNPGPQQNVVQPPPSPVSEQYQPQQQAEPQPVPHVVAPEVNSTPAAPSVTPAPAPQMPSAQPAPSSPPVQNMGGAVAFNAGASTGAAVVKKQGGRLSHMLLVFGVVVFLLAYTFMWIWIFKIKVPFLSS